MRNKALVATAGFGLVLAACIIGGTLAVGLWQFGSLRSQTTAQILDTAISVGTYVNEQRARRLELVSRDIAADASFAPQIIQLLGAREAAADTGDAAAIRNALDERRRSAALDAIALLDANGKLVAEIGDTFLAEHVLGSLPFVIKSRAEKVQASAVLDDDARLPVATATPITQDAELKALLITGVRVPADLPRTMSGVAKAEFALIAIEPTGPSVVNSTLATKTAEQLSAAVENDRNRWVNAAPTQLRSPDRRARMDGARGGATAGRPQGLSRRTGATGAYGSAAAGRRRGADGGDDGCAAAACRPAHHRLETRRCAAGGDCESVRTGNARGLRARTQTRRVSP